MRELAVASGLASFHGTGLGRTDALRAAAPMPCPQPAPIPFRSVDAKT